MKSILAIGLATAATLTLLGGPALAQTLRPQPGPLAPKPGSFGAIRAPAPYTPQPVYTPPAPYKYTPSYAAPKPPSAPAPPAMAQPEAFKPYKPKSVYSTRGGLDSYPKPAKPKGYVDLR